MKRSSLTTLLKQSAMLLALSFSTPSFSAETPIIAAAASTKFALEEIAKAFRQDSGKNLRISYASSGSLTQQIQQGAPFELFLSANKQYVERLSRQGKTIGTGVTYALGRLVLLTNRRTKTALDAALKGIEQLIQNGQLSRFAIANPEHAPYGIAARQVLQNLKLWEAIKPHLVLGENVAQAAQFSSSGAAQAGLVSYSLALAPNLRNRSRSQLIPSGLHQPIEQHAILLKNAGETAKLFFKYLQGGKAGKILSHYGYTKP